MEISKLNWWNRKRFEYNKGLLITGIIAVALTAFAFYFIAPGVIPFLYFHALIYLFYVTTLNFVFILFESVDRLFGINMNEKRRNYMFEFLYWPSLTLPFMYPLFIVLTALF